MTSPMPEQPQPQQVQLPVECMPQPLPMAWVVQTHPSGHISVTFFDATGQRVIILEPAAMQKLIDDISDQLPAARSGLVIPR